MEIRYSKKFSEDTGTDMLNKVKFITEGNSDIIPKNDHRMAVIIDGNGPCAAIYLPYDEGKIIDVSEAEVPFKSPPQVVIVNGDCEGLIIPSVNWILDNTL